MEISQPQSGWIHRGKITCILKGRWNPAAHFPSSLQDDFILDGQPGTLCRANFRRSLRDSFGRVSIFNPKGIESFSPVLTQ